MPEDSKHLLVILLSCVLSINLIGDIRSLCERMGQLYSCYLRRLECLIIGRGVILLSGVLFHKFDRNIRSLRERMGQCFVDLLWETLWDCLGGGIRHVLNE